MHVLVIDDDLVILNIISLLLGFENIQTTTVDNIQQAYDLIPTLQPDVICCDLMMPDGGGLTLLGEKRHYLNSHTMIPVVVITGCNSPQMLEDAKLLGSTAIVQKPFSGQQLLAAIRDAAPVAVA